MVPCEITHAHRRPLAGPVADRDTRSQALIGAMLRVSSAQDIGRTVLAGERVDSVVEAGFRGLCSRSDT